MDRREFLRAGAMLAAAAAASRLALGGRVSLAVAAPPPKAADDSARPRPPAKTTASACRSRSSSAWSARSNGCCSANRSWTSSTSKRTAFGSTPWTRTYGSGSSTSASTRRWTSRARSSSDPAARIGFAEDAGRDPSSPLPREQRPLLDKPDGLRIDVAARKMPPIPRAHPRGSASSKHRSRTSRSGLGPWVSRFS